MDDEEDGSYFDRLQKDALAASIRSVVRKSALWMASVIDVFAGPSESAVNLTSKFGIQRWLFILCTRRTFCSMFASSGIWLSNGAVSD
jgi:hypothetical protein